MKTPNAATGLVIGFGFGLAVGIAMENLALWLPVGFAMGLMGFMGAGSGGAEDEQQDSDEHQDRL
jgi:hypothetical protein